MDCYPVDNILLVADSYKTSHHLQYPPNTTLIYSYFESRGGKFPYTVFFGLQYILKRWLQGPVVTKKKIQEAKELLSAHLRNDSVFNEDGWNYIVEHHGGHLPVLIRAVPEGSVVPTHNVLFTVENTDPKVPWLTSYLETLLVQTWYPMTVATSSRVQKQIIHKYLKETHTNIDMLCYKLHDFGYRGASSVETACIGGAAHLVNFRSSDTVGAIPFLRKNYSCHMGAFSGSASEHSTMTTWGQEGELEACRNMIESSIGGSVAIVGDSYDIWNCCENILGTELKSLILEHARRGGSLQVRPDSGDPVTVVLKVLEILGNCFGSEVNVKGFKLLPSFLRVIQGDGINYYSIVSILEAMKEKGWSAENVWFGSGGALLQKVDRDTQKCAFKCSYAIVDGEGREIFKDPITDPGKKSKKGRLSLHLVNGTYRTFEHGEMDNSKNLLIPVFENGKILVDYTFEEIRHRAELTPDEDPVPYINNSS